MAGLDRTSDVEALSPHLAELFQLDPADNLKFIVGNDATLLSVPMIADRNGMGGVAVVSGEQLSSSPSTFDLADEVLVLFPRSGTGSVAFSFTKTPSGLPIFHQRAGGYGHLLGDDGSGYHIGKMAIVSALSAFDKNQPFTEFQKAVYKHFQCEDDPQLLLQRVHEEKSPVFPESSSATRVASVCKAVFDTAYAAGHQDDDAEAIISAAADSVAVLVRELINDVIRPEQCTLVLGGSLYRDSHFEGTVIRSLLALGISFKSVQALEDAGAAAALILAKEVL